MAYRAFFLSCFLLLFSAEVYGADIPALQEWYHINSTWEFSVRGPMSYIPNFDTANGGYHATVMGVTRPNRSGIEMWYHRSKEDTEPQSGWFGGSANVTQVDLNGDGALDYIYDFGRIIRGIKNGVPPEDTVIAEYDWVSGYSAPFTIADFNNDGINDVLANLNSSFASKLFSVLVGGSDLKQLKYTLYPRIKDGFLNAEYFLGLLKAKAPDSSFRIVTLPYDPNSVKWCSLVLKKMTTEMLEDSLAISLQTLDSISFNTVQTREWILAGSSKLYRSLPDGKEYLLATVRNFDNNARYTIVYDLTNDHLNEIVRFRTDHIGLHTLNADINGDGYWDWAVRRGNILYFYAGQKEGIDTVALGSYQLPCSDYIESLAVIGDVNNDGIRDIAIAIDPDGGVDGCFAIILGAPLRTVDVPEPVTGYKARTFDMQQNYPNPIGTDRKTFLPITTERPDNFTLELYDFTGRLIGTLFTATLPVGNHVLTLDLTKYSLSAGMYVVRLRGTTSTRERAILID